MVTENDRLQFLDYLSVRPRPEPLESFRSYLVRTAQLNGVSSMRHWYHILQLKSRNSMIIRDNPPLNFGAMPRLLKVTQAQLLATTFHYIQEKFLCDRSQLIKLMDGILAAHFRYCPLCLVESGYYRLTWRLLAIPGCIHHHCRLRETCPRCERHLSLFVTPLQIGVCPHCGHVLADAPVTDLTDGEDLTTCVRTADMVYLLQPQPVAYQRRVEEKLVRLRQLLGVSFEEMARYLGLRQSALREFEQKPSTSILERYLDYADYLGLSLREVLAYCEHPLDLSAEEVDTIRAMCDAKRQALMARADAYENALLPRVIEAVAYLRRSSQSDGQVAIGRLIRVNPSEMILYPQVKRYLEQD